MDDDDYQGGAQQRTNKSNSLLLCHLNPVSSFAVSSSDPFLNGVVVVVVLGRWVFFNCEVCVGKG